MYLLQQITFAQQNLNKALVKSKWPILLLGKKDNRKKQDRFRTKLAQKIVCFV
jgi:3'-phosphoadenosine 5'-phosphosulfate sulfotransferase